MRTSRQPPGGSLALSTDTDPAIIRARAAAPALLGDRTGFQGPFVSASMFCLKRHHKSSSGLLMRSHSAVLHRHAYEHPPRHAALPQTHLAAVQAMTYYVLPVQGVR